MKQLMFSFILLVLMACSSESDSESKGGNNEHVWKTQTDSLDKAAEVEGIILNSAEQTRNAIESNN